MRVYVAGASGAVGQPLASQLLAAGHEVTGMTRREERAAEIRAAGAECAVCDVYDTEALNAAVAAAGPEVVVHELTALPWKLDPRQKGIYDANNRVRREGTRNLIAAARAAGARRFVAQSIAFVYAPIGAWVKSEEDPLIEAAGEIGESVDAIRDLERQVLEAPGLEGLVLRYGWFYGPGTGYGEDGFQAQEVRKRRFPVIGAGTGTFSFVHVDDAAAATVAAVGGGAPGIYNVCDDDPAPMRDWLPVYAEALGARRPLRVPAWLARWVAGKAIVAQALGLRGASNAKAKGELGWAPTHSSWRQGFSESLG